VEVLRRALEALVIRPNFWRGKRVLVTGHTGFKGSWLAFLLRYFGASVFGYALRPSTSPSLFRLLRLDELIESQFGDVRDRAGVESAMRAIDPEIVFHLASQPLVRESLSDPVTTFETNVIGLVYVIEAARRLRRNVLMLNVTTDKVYDDCGVDRPHAESDRLGGADPYSSSKACAELVTASYNSSVLAGTDSLRICTARAGNVIGGGDWSADRIVPDIVRAITAGQDVILRYPNATRPWQHVLEPLSGYLTLIEAMCKRGEELDSAWNFGPNPAAHSPTVAELAERLIAAFGAPLRWVAATSVEPEERRSLQIDSARAERMLAWRPRLTMDETVQWTAQWYLAWRKRKDLRAFTLQQIDAYFRGAN